MPYKSLDTDQNIIRLMHLSPASSEDDALKCRFTLALLNGNPQYEALSYVWGELSTTPYSIEVGGLAVEITANLHSALKHLRLSDRERALWVDAICINQTDDREKCHQVSRMGSIYGQASQVVVWLGEGWDGSDMAVEFLRKLGENKNLHLDPRQAPSIYVDGLYLNSPVLCGHLIRLFDLPWWKRTWTVQEFVLARKLVFQCSRSFITREMMFMARENFWNHKDRCCQQKELERRNLEGLSVARSFTQPARLDFVIKRHKSRYTSYSVLSAIATFCRREVSNDRSRVYGMLGLGTGEYADLVEPDYTLSPEEICEAVVIKSVERTKTLEFLSHLFDHQNPKLPSFIPNWTGPFAWEEVYENRLGRVKWFNTSLDQPADLKLISHKMATTSGVIFDVVTATGSKPLSEYGSDLEPLKELYSLSGVVEPSEEMYNRTGDSRLVSLWHSLCGGTEMFFKDSNRYHRRLKGSKDLTKYAKWKTFFAAAHHRKVELWDNELSQIYVDIDTATRGRRFFNTKRGYFGFAPQKCQAGDLVVVLAGGKVPYVIRPVPLQSGETGLKRCYTILGDSYVHGIMYGEVFELLDESEREFKEIVLM